MNNKLKSVVGLIIVVVLVTTAIIKKEHLPKSQSSNSNTISNHLNSEKPWITGVYSGIRISTPEKLSEKNENMSEQQKSLISNTGSYSFANKEIVIHVYYFQPSNNEAKPDLENGLKSGISKGVNRAGGTNFIFNTEDAPDGNKKIGFGTFQAGKEIMEYKEIIYCNVKNEVGMVVIIGPQSEYTNKLISKIISSVEYLF